MEQDPNSPVSVISLDEETLRKMGYKQELLRRMSGFSNFAISFSIICILAGGITSFQQGISSIGGAAIGIAWPVACFFILIVAAAMGQIASAYPTAGGLYHWASILGGRGWGWATAWFNLMGLITCIGAINLGNYFFTKEYLSIHLGLSESSASAAFLIQLAIVSVITLSQAFINHRGIKLTTKLTNFSGYWILFIATSLTGALFFYSAPWDFSRLISFSNYSGAKGGDIWPSSQNIGYLFLLSFLLPAYTITGFDASAHTAEETIDAAHNVPKGIWQSVLISAVAGFVLLSALLLSIGDMDATAAKGVGVFHAIITENLPSWLSLFFFVGISVAQYLCALATVTSTSRMIYAFARDGGLLFSNKLRTVSKKTFAPAAAIWTAAVLAVAFTIYTPVYTTVAAAAAIFLYVSYVIPIALGFFAHGKTWTKMGPFHFGRWYKLLAVLSVFSCVGLMIVGMQAPNEKNVWIIGGLGVFLAVVWSLFEKKRFKGPPLIRP